MINLFNEFSFDLLLIPLGIATFLGIISTLLIGLFIRKNRKILLPWHKRIAFFTLALALMHGLIALFQF